MAQNEVVFQDRLWRKNRNPANYIVCNNGNTDLGNGIDLNRNFNFLWMSKFTDINK